METADFEEEDMVVLSQTTPKIMLCCAPVGMERDALLRRLNFDQPPGIRFVLACDAPAQCEGHLPPLHALQHKHFVVKGLCQ